MSLKNGPHGYGWLSIALHWVMAIAVFGLFALGYWMVDLDYYSEWYRKAPALHKSIGISLLTLWLIRLVWRLIQTSPKASVAHKKWELKVAKTAHVLLYSLMLVIMLSGYLISTADGRGIAVFELITIPSLGEFFVNQEDIAGDIHEWLAYCLIGLATLHALAALKHHFIDKDDTLIRMLLSRGKK